MRTCLVLGGIFFAAEQTPAPFPVAPVAPGLPVAPDQHQAAHCAINGVAIADELMNSIVFIWQGVLRCGKDGHDAAECSVDVSNAIQSVNAMINVILKTVDNCGGAFNLKEKCGMAVGELTAAMAGVAATSSGIAEHCPKTAMEPVPGLSDGLNGGEFNHALAYCIIDAKGLIKAVLKVSVRIADASEDCKIADASQLSQCTAGILGVLDSVALMGEYIAGVVGHCSKPNINQKAACASEILGLIRNLNTLGFAGAKMAGTCGLNADQRLFLDNAKKGIETPDTTNSNLPTFALAALLPIAGLMSFVAGRRMSAFRQTRTFDTETPAEE